MPSAKWIEAVDSFAKLSKDFMKSIKRTKELLAELVVVIEECIDMSMEDQGSAMCYIREGLLGYLTLKEFVKQEIMEIDIKETKSVQATVLTLQELTEEERKVEIKAMSEGEKRTPAFNKKLKEIRKQYPQLFIYRSNEA